MRYNKLLCLLTVMPVFLCATSCSFSKSSVNILPIDKKSHNLLSNPTDNYNQYIHSLAQQAKNQLPAKYMQHKELTQRQVEVLCGFIVNNINALPDKLSDEQIQFILNTETEIIYNVILNVFESNVPLGYLENLPYKAAYGAYYVMEEGLQNQNKGKSSSSKNEIKAKAKAAAKTAYHKELRTLQKEVPNIGDYPTFTKEILDKAIKLSNEKYVELSLKNLSDFENQDFKTEKDALALVSPKNIDVDKFADFYEGIKKDVSGRVTGRIVSGYLDGINDIIGWEEYTYDENSRIKTVKRKDFSPYPSLEGDYSYFYDKENRLIKSIDDNKYAVFETIYKYDESGDLIGKIRTRRKINNICDEKYESKYSYDMLGRLNKVSTKYSSDFYPYSETVEYNYNSKGNVIKTYTDRHYEHGQAVIKKTYKGNRLVEIRNIRDFYNEDMDFVILYEYYDNGILKMETKIMPSDIGVEKTYTYFDKNGETEYQLTLTTDKKTGKLLYNNSYGCSVRLIKDKMLYRYNENLELTSSVSY